MKVYQCSFCVTDMSTFFTDTVNAPFQWIAYLMLRKRNKGCVKISKIKIVKE